MNSLCFMTNLSSSDLAAWVQAIGTIAAVGAALIVVIWQHHLEKLRVAKSHRDLVTRYLSSAISLAGGVKQNAETLRDWCEMTLSRKQELFFMAKNVESISNALNNIPIWELDTFELIVNVVPIQSLSKILLETVRYAENLEDGTLNWKPTTKLRLNNVIPEINKILSTLLEIQKARDVAER
jgi:hypothetical protein